MEDWVTAVCGPVPGAQEQTSSERGRLGTGDSGESLELLALIFPPAAIPASEAGRRESPAAVGTDQVSSGRLPAGVRSSWVLPREEPGPSQEPALGVQSLPHPALLSLNQGSACVHWLGTQGDGGNLSPRGSLCVLSLTLSPSWLALCCGLRGYIIPLAPRWVPWLPAGSGWWEVLVRGGWWEGGLQKGEARHRLPPCPLPRSPPPARAPISAVCCCRGRLLPAGGPLCPSSPRVPAASCPCDAYLPAPLVGFSVFHHQSNQFHILNSLF